MNLLMLLTLGCDRGLDVPPRGSPAPHAEARRLGGCKAGGAGTLGVTPEVYGSTVVLHLVDVKVECDSNPAADIEIASTTLSVVLSERGLEPDCGCTCVYDFDVTLLDVPPGNWTVALHHQGVLLGTTLVTVE